MGATGADTSSRRQRPDLLVMTRAGMLCPRGGFYIDPAVGVDVAVITHAHSDHARRGSRHYIAAKSCLPLLRERLGDVSLQGLDYGEPLRLGDAWVSLHPAGHILGSAQVRVEVDGEVWVHSGDYKRDDDPTCEPFEVVTCDTFITEATFGLPIYRWPPAADVARDILAWWDRNRALGRSSVLLCYSLGKAQRVLAELARVTERPVHLHPQVDAMTSHYRAAGVAVGRSEPLLLGAAQDLAEALAIVPPGAVEAQPGLVGAATAFVSGWMAVPKQRRHRGVGFVVSDHADWLGLVQTARQTGARRVLVTHGDGTTLARYLREQDGLDARPLSLQG